MAEMLKKMSPKTVLSAEPGKLKPENDGEVKYLFTIFGTARDVRSGESSYGAWSSLIGQFEAIVPGYTDENGNEIPERVCQSAQCFLPEPMHSMMVSKLREVDSQAIDFGVQVLIKTRADTAKGYEYLGEMIQDPSAADPLEQMRQKARKALPSPVAEKEPPQAGVTGKGKGKAA